jgi:DNA (cytosine-5)-methyltransferase 1
LRIEEIKRLQTFPDEFQLAGDVEKQWRQVGNAVPPQLAFVIAECVGAALTMREGTLTRVAAGGT